ncbi:MAG: hypothetical protein NTX50_29920 [Candidatus Sumerlaeota bacterium]|nr:hypothetical protein [Candidatus Sumerlaeota bacterium]
MRHFFSAWIRIVDSRLCIRKNIFRERRIFFEEIREVRFQPWHALGRRNLLVETDQGDCVLESAAPGFLLAVLASRALAKDRLAPEVAEYLQSYGLSSKPDAPWLNTAQYIGRATALLLWIVALPALWKGEGIPWVAGIAFALSALLLIPWVTVSHEEHKRVAAYLLWNLLLCPLLWAITGWITGRLAYIQWATIVFAIYAICALAAIRWNGHPRHLIPALSAVFAVMILSVALVPGNRASRTETLFHGNSTMPSFQWLHEGQGAAFIDDPPDLPHEKKREAVLYVLTPGGERREFDLPREPMGFFPVREKDSIAMVASTTSCSKSLPLIRLRNLKELEKSNNLPDCWCLGRMGASAEEIWSLDGRFLLHAACADRARSDRQDAAEYAAFDTTTKQDILLQGQGVLCDARWHDDHHFEALALITPSAAVTKTTAARRIEIELREYDALTGAYGIAWRQTITYHSTIPYIENSFLHLRGSSLALIRECCVPDPQSTDTVTLYLVNLRDGQRKKIGHGPTQELMWEWDWNSRLQLLTGLCRAQETGGPNSLVIFSFERGIVARKDLPPDAVVQGPHLSPDGKKVFYICRSKSRRYIVSAWSQPEVWNTVTGATRRIYYLGALQSMFASGYEYTTGDYAPLQWAPDSGSIVMPILKQLSLSDGQKLALFRIWIED